MKKLTYILLTGFAAIGIFSINACEENDCSDDDCNEYQCSEADCAEYQCSDDNSDEKQPSDDNCDEYQCSKADCAEYQSSDDDSDNKEYGEAITNRLETGFLNYNKGYLAWLEWCDELYDKGAFYNVYGNHFTLDLYKRLMGAMFEQFEISLGGKGDTAGDIGTIIIDSDIGKAAISYTVSFRKKSEEEWVSIDTMEFVQFRTDKKFGARVMEGWALSSAEIEPDEEVIAFWMNPGNDWDALMARVDAWESK